VTPLDEEDQAKLDTWFSVMNLLEHYRALSFEPMQRGLRFSMRLRYIQSPPDGFVVVDDDGKELRRWLASDNATTRSVATPQTS
jgi:hypothetical protein